MKYLKISKPVEAIQWFKSGDHPNVEDYKPIFNGETARGQLPNGRLVRPGDWIIDGEYPCPDELFKENYEPIKWTVSIEHPELVDTIKKIIELLQSLIEGV